MRVKIRVSQPPVAPVSDVPPNTAFDGPPLSTPAPGRPGSNGLGGSSRVALGILLSRISGLIRERVIGHYFGNSIVVGIFRAAFKIPNLLSNLFGEGVLSAAFVTVYTKLRAQQRDEEARRLAAAVFTLLLLVTTSIVLVGMLATPLLVNLIAPGFHGADRELTIRLVRILFPAAGFLVLSAWCLGVLNSHRQFLLSYSASIAMNAAMISALVLFGRYLVQKQSVVLLAWSCVVGSILTCLVQLPSVLRLLPHFRPIWDITSDAIRSVIRSFGPVFVSRGVVQISSYIDQMIATFLGGSAVAALSYGQFIAVLPVSLFSMSVSAAELPELSSAVGTQEEVAAHLRKRLNASLRRIAFFIVPCAVAFLVIGDILVAALYQGGRFDYAATVYVWSVLAGASVGLLATSLGRLYSSAFYALQDTRAPLRFAMVRVLLTSILGLLFAFPLPHWLGLEPKWGVAGLTASAGIAGWVEFALLRHGLSKRIGSTTLPIAFSAPLWVFSFLAAGTGYGLKTILGMRHPLPLAFIVIVVYVGIYFGGTALLGVQESRSLWKAVVRRTGFAH